MPSERVEQALRAIKDNIALARPWPDIADAGNIYCHAYDGVQERIVLQIVRLSLPALEQVVDEELSSFPDP